MGRGGCEGSGHSCKRRGRGEVGTKTDDTQSLVERRDVKVNGAQENCRSDAQNSVLGVDRE